MVHRFGQSFVLLANGGDAGDEVCCKVAQVSKDAGMGVSFENRICHGFVPMTSSQGYACHFGCRAHAVKRNGTTC